MRRRSVRLGVVLACGAVALLAGFSWRKGANQSGAASPATVDSIHYELAWSWDGARWDDDRKAYVLTSDRGYQVWLTAAYIGTASLELVPCRPEVPATPLKSALDFLRPAQAFANHGYIHDGSLVEAPVVDSAFRKETIAFGVGKGSGKRYCQLHELLVPLDARGADGFHLDHWSAFVRGSFALPGGVEEHPFEAHVNLRGGALVDLVTLPSVTPSGFATVRVTRSPVHAFDGAALEKLTPSELAYAFMRGLTKGTRAELIPAR